MAGWFSDTLSAKSRADQLQKQVDKLTAQVDYYAQQAILNQPAHQPDQARQQHRHAAPTSPWPRNVIGRDPTLWYQTIEVDKGSDDGVSLNDPVTGDGALVGKVTTRRSDASRW